MQLVVGFLLFICSSIDTVNTDVPETENTQFLNQTVSASISEGTRTTIVAQPSITYHLKDQCAAVGRTFSFLCAASGSPPPTFTWKKNGVKINQRSKRFHIFSGAHSSHLKIKSVRKEDYGNYSCVANNGIGNTATTTALLTVYKELDAPRSIRINVINSTAISVTWYPPLIGKLNKLLKGNKKIRGFHVVSSRMWQDGKHVYDYFDHREYKIKWNKKNRAKAKKNETIVVIPNLKPDTRYGVRVVGYTNARVGKSSAIHIVRTALPVPEAPFVVKADFINSTTIRLGWWTPTGLSGRNIIKGYYVYYTEWNKVDETRGQEHVIDTAGSARNEAVIKNVRSGTTYSVQVAAYTRRTVGKRSKQQFIKTTGPVPTSLDVMLNLTIKDDNCRLIIYWSEPTSTHGELKGYTVMWRRKGDYYFKRKLLSVLNHTFITDVLDKGKIYEVQVFARNENGDGEKTIKFVRTPDGVPTGIPKHLEVTSQSNTSVLVTWEFPEKEYQNGNITLHQLLYHKLIDPSQAADWRVLSINITSPVLQHVVDNMDPDTYYVFQVRAFTTRGPGPWNPIIYHQSLSNNSERLKQRTQPTNRTKKQKMRRKNSDEIPKDEFNGYIKELKRTWKCDMIPLNLSMHDQ